MEALSHTYSNIKYKRHVPAKSYNLASETVTCLSDKKVEEKVNESNYQELCWDQKSESPLKARPNTLADCWKNHGMFTQ